MKKTALIVTFVILLSIAGCSQKTDNKKVTSSADMSIEQINSELEMRPDNLQILNRKEDFSKRIGITEIPFKVIFDALSDLTPVENYAEQNTDWQYKIQICNNNRVLQTFVLNEQTLCEQTITDDVYYQMDSALITNIKAAFYRADILKMSLTSMASPQITKELSFQREDKEIFDICCQIILLKQQDPETEPVIPTEEGYRLTLQNIENGEEYFVTETYVFSGSDLYENTELFKILKQLDQSISHIMPL